MDLRPPPAASSSHPATSPSAPIRHLLHAGRQYRPVLRHADGCDYSRAAHRKQAMEMLLTGETIDASTAKDFGLVNRIVPKQYLTQVVTKYASVIASKSPMALRIGKEAFYRQLEMPVEEAYGYAAEVMVDSVMTTMPKRESAPFWMVACRIGPENNSRSPLHNMRLAHGWIQPASASSRRSR
jgi:hypothetical protein